RRWRMMVLIGFCAAQAPLMGAEPLPAVTPTPAQAQPAGLQPKAVVEERELNFGQRCAGEKVEHTFVIKNTGEAPLEITTVNPACGCPVAGDYEKPAPPGGETRLPFGLNTPANQQHPDLSKSILVETNDPTQPRITLVIKGLLRKRVQ